MRIKITYIHVCVHECVCACMSTAGIIAAVVENRYAGHQSMSEAQANGVGDCGGQAIMAFVTIGD